MIQGIRALPWIINWRREESGPVISCGTCQASRWMRREWHCGLIDRREWSGAASYPRPRTGWPWRVGEQDEPDTCPYALIELPSVREAARARLHWSKGQLDGLYSAQGDQVTPTLIEHIEYLEEADAAVLDHIRQQSRDRRAE